MAKLANETGRTEIKILWVGKTEKPNEAKTFVKRDFAIQITEIVNDNEYKQDMVLQVTGDTEVGKTNNTTLLDDMMPNDIVDLTYTIRGNCKETDKLQPTPQNPKCMQGFNNITCTKITKIGGSTVPATDKASEWQSQQNNKPKKPDVIPDGKTWNEATGKLEDLPF
jgi:hypothetical protein